jgi:hypothetical protein
VIPIDRCWECDEAAQGPPPLCDRCVRAARQCVQRGFRVHERGPARERKALRALVAERVRQSLVDDLHWEPGLPKPPGKCPCECCTRPPLWGTILWQACASEVCCALHMWPRRRAKLLAEQRSEVEGHALDAWASFARMVVFTVLAFI